MNSARGSRRVAPLGRNHEQSAANRPMTVSITLDLNSTSTRIDRS